MKQIFLLVLGLLISAKLFAQQEEPRCNSTEYLQYLKTKNPNYAQLLQQSEINLQNYIASHKNAGQRSVITIPVVVHLIYNPDSTKQQLSDWQIVSQIDAMNEDYRRFNADNIKTPAEFDSVAADCELEFCLAQRDPNGNTTTGIVRVSSTSTFPDFNSVKSSATGGDDPWNFHNYLNIWVCPLDYPLLGYATFPSSSIDSTIDGVVIHYKAFGRINTASKKYTLGRTGTHEVGHWLNLIHPWGDDGGGCSLDDHVDDTPLQDNAHYKCEQYPFSSSCSPSEMFMCYMDYTIDSCMNIFTLGERQRMLSALNLFRTSILTSPACNPVAVYNSDCGITKILSPDEYIYGTEITPVIRLHNFGSQTVTSTEIHYAKNWKSTLNTFNWSGSLAPNADVDVTLPQIPDSSWYNLFTAYTKNPNGVQDEDTINDFKTKSYIVNQILPVPKDNNILIYPNPTGTLITINIVGLDTISGSYSVYNLLGQKLFAKMDELSLTKFQLDLSNFPSGIYFIQLNINKTILNRKIIIQHEL